MRNTVVAGLCAGLGRAGLCAGLLFVSCRAPVGVKPAQPQAATVQPVESLRGVDSLSRETQQLLRVFSLAEKLPQYPTAVVAVLGGLRGSEFARQALAAEAEVAALVGLNAPASSPSEAASWFLLAAARAYEFMFGGDVTAMERAMDPRFQRMRRVYNVAVSSYVGLLEETQGGFRNHEQATRFELFQVDIKTGSERLDPRGADELLVARELSIRGLRNRYVRDGLGAALVSYHQNRQRVPEERFYSPEGYVDPITAVLEFGPRVAGIVGMARSVTLSFYDPRDTEIIETEGLEVPLQADFSTHNAYLVSISPISGIARKALLNAEEWTDRMGLYLLEEYDPDRIPLIMVHGLRSSPLAWMELSNDIYGDPQLRSRYQIWQFFYPSALPYLYVGRILRNEIRAVQATLDPEGDDAAMQSFVVVAHSMGGLVTRSLVCDSGMKIWDAAFTAPPDQLRGLPEDVEWIQEMFIFEHLEEIDRVVFVATPHRGAERATSLLGQMGSSLVDLPEELLVPAERMQIRNQDLLTPAWAAMMQKGPPDSIRSLRPENPLLQAVGTLPIAPGIPYHTIMGNRGRPPDLPITDGWVDYDSVHLEGAVSEAIVPSGHAAYAHPATIAEIKRILRLHLRTADTEN